MTTPEIWYDATKNEAHALVWLNVRQIEADQAPYFERIRLLRMMYDPHGNEVDEQVTARAFANMTENLVATNVDAMFATTFQADVRARFLTTGAPFSAQRRAKKLEYYSEGIGELLGQAAKCRLAAKEAGKVGAGLIKAHKRFNAPVLEHVLLDDVYVPDEDTNSGGQPMQLHHVQRKYDREQLKAEYPDHADDIDRVAGSRMGTTFDAYVSRSLTSRRKLTVIESTRLPIGTKGAKGYIAGRRTVTIESATLADEPYHKPHHRFAALAWSERKGSFYPISGAERIAGHQTRLDKLNWQIDRTLDQSAMLTTFVRPGDMNFQVKSTRIGNVVAIKGDFPQTPTPPAVHPETYKARVDVRESAKVEFGLPNLADGRSIPAGLETGAAVREARAAQTQHFSPQEAAFETFVLEVSYLVIDVCKDLGASAPTVIESRWKKPIAWADVDMGEVRTQISAASTLPRTAAGLEQTILEWAQAGIISKDSVTRLIDHPDLESELSMYTAALDAIDLDIETILDGGEAWPDPYDNLHMIAWRGVGQLKNAQVAGAPEEIIDTLGDYIAQAAFLLSEAQNDNAAASAPGAGAGALPGEVQPPAAGQPTAALAPEAMQLRAGTG